jgi:DNA-binding MarR family transcriptional regulator
MLVGGRAAAPRLPSSLSESAGFLLSKLAQEANERVQQQLGEMGIKSRHYSVLAVLDHNGPLSQQAVGELLRIDRTTMVAIVDELERLGFASRQADPRDRRANRLELTPAGCQSLEAAEHLVARANAELVAPLRPADQRQLLDLLRQLSRV